MTAMGAPHLIKLIIAVYTFMMCLSTCNPATAMSLVVYGNTYRGEEDVNFISKKAEVRLKPLSDESSRIPLTLGIRDIDLSMVSLSAEFSDFTNTMNGAYGEQVAFNIFGVQSKKLIQIPIQGTHHYRVASIMVSTKTPYAVGSLLWQPKIGLIYFVTDAKISLDLDLLNVTKNFSGQGGLPAIGFDLRKKLFEKYQIYWTLNAGHLSANMQTLTYTDNVIGLSYRYESIVLHVGGRFNFLTYENARPYHELNLSSRGRSIIFGVEYIFK